jgi:hypothetical protein
MWPQLNRVCGRREDIPAGRVDDVEEVSGESIRDDRCEYDEEGIGDGGVEERRR